MTDFEQTQDEVAEAPAKKTRRKKGDAPPEPATWDVVADASQSASLEAMGAEYAPAVDGIDGVAGEAEPDELEASGEKRMIVEGQAVAPDALRFAGSRCTETVIGALSELRSHFHFSPLPQPANIETPFPGEVRRFSETATDKLTDVEKDHVAMEMARGLAQRNILKETKDAFNKAFKALDEEISANLGELSDMYRSGERTVTILAIECRDEDEMIIRIRRGDTGEQTRSRAMTLAERERQMDLFDGRDAVKKEPSHNDDGVLLSDDDVPQDDAGEGYEDEGEKVNEYDHSLPDELAATGQ